MKKFKVDGIIWKWQKWDYLTAVLKLFKQTLIDPKRTFLNNGTHKIHISHLKRSYPHYI